MKNSTQRQVRNLSIAILFFATITIISIYGQMISQLWTGPLENRVIWSPDKKGWQIFIIGGRALGLAALYAFCWIFLVRTLRAMKSGEIFPRSNISLIRWTALVTVLSTLTKTNYSSVISGENVSMLDSNTFFVPLVVLLFAGLYKMAYLAAKDSNLTI